MMVNLRSLVLVKQRKWVPTVFVLVGVIRDIQL